jgi:hypothetical protein
MGQNTFNYKQFTNIFNSMVSKDLTLYHAIKEEILVPENNSDFKHIVKMGMDYFRLDTACGNPFTPEEQLAKFFLELGILYASKPDTFDAKIPPQEPITTPTPTNFDVVKQFADELKQGLASAGITASVAVYEVDNGRVTELQ